MKDLYPLSGVVAIPQTPFDDDDRIDFDSLHRGVADRLAAGVDGLLYPVVASEVSHLTASELQPFRCIKVETVPAGSKYTAILGATGGRLNVSAGWAVPQLIEALDRGIHAVTPGGLHWVIVDVVRRYRAGDRASARALFDRLLPILGWQNQHIDIS